MAQEAPSGVLRFSRSDDRSSFVVIHVYSRGANPLDLELVASEGQSAWGATIRENQTQKLKASGNQAEDAAWEAALKSSLLLDSCPRSLISELEGLETVATITPDGDMTLVFRRNIGELTQRLGTILLQPIEDEKFDLWSGCATGAKLAAQASQHANKLEYQLVEEIEKNRKLEKQLQDFIRAKEEHEGALLRRFTELLNAKKLKIRNQQRLLSVATAGIEKMDTVQSAVPGALGSSRASKRRTVSNARDSASDDESSDGFESVQDEDEPIGDAATPEPQEDDETDDEEEPIPSPPLKLKMGIKRNLTRRTTESELVKSKPSSQTFTSQDLSRKLRKQQEEDDEPPPRRELPFAQRRAAQAAERKHIQEATPSQANSAAFVQIPSSVNIDGDDTTDDDEL